MVPEVAESSTSQSEFSGLFPLLLDKRLFKENVVVETQYQSSVLWLCFDSLVFRIVFFCVIYLFLQSTENNQEHVDFQKAFRLLLMLFCYLDPPSEGRYCDFQI